MGQHSSYFASLPKQPHVSNDRRPLILISGKRKGAASSRRVSRLGFHAKPLDGGGGAWYISGSQRLSHRGSCDKFTTSTTDETIASLRRRTKSRDAGRWRRQATDRAAVDLASYMLAGDGLWREALPGLSDLPSSPHQGEFGSCLFLVVVLFALRQARTSTSISITGASAAVRLGSTNRHSS